jgi:putative flavoprotein involved in K+ transport
MTRPRRARAVETVIVGAGQSGLMVSDLLRQVGREHLVLERRPTLGGAWQDRWDSFQLVSPNWLLSVAGFSYGGDDPDGYMPRDEIVDHFRAYGTAITVPVEFETDVTGLDPTDHGPARFRLRTSRGQIDARTVVVAGGPFTVPHVPTIGSAIDASVHQVHVHDYRNPESLPPGGVLVVGSGQSGVQLAEELMAVGRSVTMAVGHCGRFPRTYRGLDAFWWLRELAIHGPAVGVHLPSPQTLPDPRLRLACNPQLSGHGVRHDTNLRAMSIEGLRLVGRLDAVEGTRLRFAPDLSANLRFADGRFGEQFKPLFDTYAERAGLTLPLDELAQVDHEPPEVAELDLAAEGITSVLWTSGYRPSFGWIRLPVFDELGLPIQVRGITQMPGLAFIGTPWLVDMASANLVGVERDAIDLVAALGSRWP